MIKDKRLELRLPSDHWIWQYPPGSRSKRMREALGLMESLQRTLTNLDKRLEQVEEMLASGELIYSDGRDRQEKHKSCAIKFDTDAFMNI
ncbi:MAG: hypothetical protein FH756_01935 [Firmicutes bacterium]|nr:hypothetical protein [Bacillota bacterium]